MKKRKLPDEERKKNSFLAHLEEDLKDPRYAREFEGGWRKLKLGYQIFCAREAAGMTQQMLACKIGTRQSNISRLEQGDYNFTVEMLQKVARALNLQLRIELKAPEHKQAA